MSTIYHCLTINNNYIPPLKELVFEAKTEDDAIQYLLKLKDGGIYRNTLHHFECYIEGEEI